MTETLIMRPCCVDALQDASMGCGRIVDDPIDLDWTSA